MTRNIDVKVTRVRVYERVIRVGNLDATGDVEYEARREAIRIAENSDNSEWRNNWEDVEAEVIQVLPVNHD